MLCPVESSIQERAVIPPDLIDGGVIENDEKLSALLTNGIERKTTKNRSHFVGTYILSILPFFGVL